MSEDESLRQACIKFLEELLPTLYKSDMTSHNLVLRFAKQQQAVGVRMVAENWRNPAWAELSEKYPIDTHPQWSDTFVSWCEAQAKELEA